MLIVAMAFGVSAGTVGEGTVNVQSLTAQYTVKTGDTLTGIAHSLFGRASAWKEIETTNQTVIKNPNFIKPGMILTYSVEAAQQSMAQVLREKELRKLAGKQTTVRSAKNSIKTHKIHKQVMYKQSFGPVHKKALPKVVVAPKSKAVVAPADVKRSPASVPPQKLSRITGFKNLEI